MKNNSLVSGWIISTIFSVQLTGSERILKSGKLSKEIFVGVWLHVFLIR